MKIRTKLNGMTRTVTMLFSLASTVCAQEFEAHLAGVEEVPPGDIIATGEGTFILTSNILTYAVTVERLLGWSVAIHGPAGPGTNAPVIFNLVRRGCVTPLPPDPGGCLFQGELTLSPEQAVDLLAGLWYVRATTGGEPPQSIRGQILLAQEDTDDDGVPDSQDSCPDTPAGSTVNSNGCSIEQLCPCDGPFRNHQAYVNCVRRKATRFWQEQLITSQERRSTIRRAERSDCPVGPVDPPPSFPHGVPDRPLWFVPVR